MEVKNIFNDSGTYLGVDVGSTTIKIALFEDGNLIFNLYERHLSMIRSKVLSCLEKIKVKRLKLPFPDPLGLELLKNLGFLLCRKFLQRANL